jgi:protein-disulfide isomerase
MSKLTLTKLTLPVGDRDHAQGPALAPLTLVEYGDYECPYCGAAYPIVKRIQEKLGQDLRFIFRNFPLASVHPHAEHAALAAEAAALQDRFWQMHDWIYEHQEMMGDHDLLEAAETLGLDITHFVRDIQSGTLLKRVKEDFQSGVRSGVPGTPTFYINGYRHDGRADYAELLSALQAALRTA